MKYILFLILLIFLNDDLNRIAFINRLKKEAEESYHKGNYEESASKYQLLLDSAGVADDKILMNLAHSYFQLQDTNNSTFYYQQLTKSNDPLLRTRAFQQLGIIESQAGRYQEALSRFKDALKADPANDSARYNYELLKKLIQEQQNSQSEQGKDNQENQDKNQKNQQDQQNTEQQQQQEHQNQEKNQQQNPSPEDQQKQETENQPKDAESGEESEGEKEEKKMMNQNPEEMKISEEKARMILEALRNREMQYIQQMKRKSAQKPESGKPDW